MSIFNKRVNIKPYEYPVAMKFVDAINDCFWVHRKWNFEADVQDYKVSMSNVERSAIKNTLLAVAQIEANVKMFWPRIHDIFPKAEFAAVGLTFGESEVRHERTYSHLLTKLGLDEAFQKLIEEPVIQRRIDYLNKYLGNATTNNKQLYTLTLALFSLFIENVSLFSQFAIIKSFNKHRNMLKDIDNAVMETQREEILHGLFGVYLLGEIKKENPDWFDDEFVKKIKRACKKSYDAESAIIDWIFEEGELDYIPKTGLDEFLKFRYNDTLKMIGIEPIFEIDDNKLEPLRWYIEYTNNQVSVDFFYKETPNYTKNTNSVTEDDLF